MFVINYKFKDIKIINYQAQMPHDFTLDFNKILIPLDLNKIHNLKSMHYDDVNHRHNLKTMHYDDDNHSQK